MIGLNVLSCVQMVSMVDVVVDARDLGRENYNARLRRSTYLLISVDRYRVMNVCL